jgi:transmembrane sensor
MKREIWDIIAKKFAGEALSKEEIALLENLSPEETGDFRDAEEVFRKTGLYYKLTDYNTNKAWDKVSGSTTKTRHINLNTLIRVAAIALIVITMGTIVVLRQSNTNKLHIAATEQNDFSAPVIILPDGTQVTLNQGSTLNYPSKFTGENREVELVGEAFFEVTPNAEKPFIINANNSIIRVVGTSFNVFAYNHAPEIEVCVKTGKVELQPKNIAQNKQLISAGEKGTYNKTTGKVLKHNGFNKNNLAWKTHEIEFEYSTLSEVIETLNRTYNLTIDVKGDVDLDQQINATFREQKPDYILNVVALTLNLNITNEGSNRYVIKGNLQ